MLPSFSENDGLNASEANSSLSFKVGTGHRDHLERAEVFFKNVLQELQFTRGFDMPHIHWSLILSSETPPSER